MRQRKRPTGYALVLVLWVMVLLVAIAAAFTANVRTDTRTAISLTDQVRLKAAADAAITRAIAQVAADNSAATTAAKRATLGDAYEIPWPNATLHIAMSSESAKIDINYAPRALLMGLFNQVLPQASAEALADATLDWRDRDDRRSPQGAEAAEYRAAERQVLPTNRPFLNITELGLVLGFNADYISQLQPYLTVYSRRPRIDPFSAGATVLNAIPGLNETLVTDFISYREKQRESGQAVRLDMLAPGIRYLERRPYLTAVAIEATATNSSGRTLTREAVVRFSGRRAPYQILEWRQTVPTLQ